MGRWVISLQIIFPSPEEPHLLPGANLATSALGLTPQVRRFWVPREEYTHTHLTLSPSLFLLLSLSLTHTHMKSIFIVSLLCFSVSSGS